MLKKYLSFLLALVILIGIVPLKSTAYETLSIDPSEGKISPDTILDRGTAAYVMWLWMGSPEPMPSHNPFTDISLDDDYYKAVLWAVNEGIVEPTSSTTFDPQTEVLRVDMACYLWCMMGKPEPSIIVDDLPYIDVDESQFYTKAILWVCESRLMTGIVPFLFDLDGPCKYSDIYWSGDAPSDLDIPYEPDPEIIAEGTCGPNTVWNLTGDGTLTISGSGAMENYRPYSKYPQWYSYRDCIEKIVITEGVTSVGDDAFSGKYTSVTEIMLPKGLTKIGRGAFANTQITSISIPKSVTEIGCSAFLACSVLKEITFMGDCPVFSSDYGSDYWNFRYVQATAYYPHGNSTWNSNTCLDYGGTLTWIPYTPDGPTEPDSPIEAEFAYCCDTVSDLFADKDAGPIELKYPFYYDDSWFLGSAKSYNHQLAQMSIRAAMAAFNSNTSEAGSDNAYYIKKLMDQLGYTYDSNSIHYPNPNHFTIGYAIGSKNISDDTSVLMVAVRGAGYKGEWYSNAIVGESRDHLGFDEASHQVGDGIYAYINEHRDELNENIKVWMFGYSRAAATTNLAAADLCDGFIDGISSEDVFAYCFECPQGTTDKNAATSKYISIKNIVNPIDFVTKVAMSGWDFTRYGVTYYMPFEGGSVDHAEPKAEMQAQYDAFLRYNGLTDDTKRINAVKSLTAESTGQAIAFRDITQLAADFIGSRKTYANTLLQSDVAALADGLMGDGLNDAEILDGLIPGILSLIVVKDAAKDAAEDPLVLLDMLSHIKTVLDMNPDALSALSSMSNLMTAHYPELCLSWMDSLDGDYKKYNGEYVKIIVNCPVDVTVYDQQGNVVAQIIDDTAVEIENGMPTYMDMDGQKVIILPDEADFDIQLRATGDGAMTYTVEQCNLEQKDSSYIVSYYDVPIETNDTLSANVSVESGSELYDAENNLIAPSLEMADEVEYCSIDVSASGHGTVSAVPVKIKSEFVKLTAESWDQESFLGWYDGDTLISQDTVYRFRVEKDVSLTARFTAEYTHRYGNWVLVQEPTVTEHGREERYCNCGVSEYRLTNKLCPFTDVPEGSFYYEPVLWAVEEGITNGATETTYNPNGTCLRAQVVTFLHRADGNPEPTSTRNPFTDVKSGDFFYKPVLWAVENGITNGTTATTFGSYANCNRAAVVTFLWRAAGSPDPDSTSNPFVDVKTTDFFYKPVLWAVENGITNGVDATHFGPATDCNRAQVVTFLYRAAKINNEKPVTPTEPEVDPSLVYVVYDDHVEITDYTGTATEISIPARIEGLPVTVIGEDAFIRCYDLINVSIPEGVTTIGDFAFQFCSNLTTISIPDTLVTIGDGAFDSCYKLNDITLPAGISHIGGSAFVNCDNLISISIPEGITAISDFTFYACDNLTSVLIPESVTSIGYRAFFYCDSLTAISIPEGVISIGNEAFAWCYHLNTINFDGNAPVFGENVFDGVTGTAYYPAYNSTWTADVMQNYGGDITWVAYNPNHFTVIAAGNCGEYATWILYSSGLLEISGTDLIGYSDTEPAPWYNYRDLITEVTLEDGITDITGYLFYNCTNLRSVTIPDSVVFFGYASFYNCSSLTEIIFPENVHMIADWAFYGCRSLEYVEIPEGISYVCSGIFSTCTSLKSITIPANVVSVRHSAFANCTSMTEIIVADGNSAYTAVDGVLFTKDLTELVQYPAGKKDTYYVIPDGVINLTASAFSGATNLEEVFIPDGLERLSDWAFSGCTSLSAIVIPSSVETIGAAFSKCSNLVSVEIMEGVKTIGSFAFQSCDKLTSIVIPESVTSIGSYIFDSCCSSKEITFRGNAPSISASAFYRKTVNAYYPAGNKTWDADAKQNYGGTITWIPYEDLMFTDVPVGAFYYESVLWAVENGITNGVDATHFGPTTDCNRAQVVTFLYRAYN